MAPVRTGAAVDDDGDQVVHPVGVDRVVGGVEEAELEGKDDAVGDLDEAVHLLHVLEALQVEREDRGEALHSHAFL